jgi:putative oxidoreductase
MRTNKCISFALGKENETTKNIALLLLRLVIGALMITHAIPKLNGFEMLKDVFPDPLGIGSSVSLVMIIFAEFICSMLIIFGILTRLATLPLIFGMCVAAFVIHGSDPLSVKELSLFYLFMYIVLLLIGPGKYSVDAILKRYAVIVR